MSLPAATRHLSDFASLLRGAGFAVAPDQTIGFIEGVGLLGPRSIADIYRAARALFAIPKARQAEFEALFRAHFMGQTLSAPLEAEGEEEEEVEAHEGAGADTEVTLEEDEEEPGLEASAAERLGHRAFPPESDSAALTRLAREAARRLPRRLTRRRRAHRAGDRPDLRRALRDAAKRDGEVLRLPTTRRRRRQRRIVLLIDISGSMSERTDASLRFAHTLTRAAERVEAFTLGTRLTRITPALRLREEVRALDRASALIADIDGGTRIGEALQSFLAVPRYAGFARGALVLVLSDGLERGEPGAMIDGVRRLSRLAWRLDWLSPLAGMPGYTPATAGLSAVLGDLDTLAPGGSLGELTDHVLGEVRR